MGFGSSQGIRIFALYYSQKPCRANVMGCLPKPSSIFKPPIVHHSLVDFFKKQNSFTENVHIFHMFPLFSSVSRPKVARISTVPSHPHCNLPLSAKEKKGRMRPATAWRSSEWKQISAQHKDRTLVMAFEGRFAIWRC